MRVRLLGSCVALLVIVAMPALAFNFVRSEPAPVPEITFLDADGNELSLADFEGKVVVLNLWATWCAPCREEMPSLDRLQAAHGGEDLQVVALSLDRGDSLDKVRRFYDEVGIETLAIYRDPEAEVGRAFRAPGLPTTIVIDPAGREIGRVLGGAKWDGPEAVALLEAAAADQR
jgi:thiol-disulfide isomerase/thioredoxin